MSLKRYEVTVTGRRETTTILQLSDDDAKLMGLTSKDEVKGDKPEAKAAPAAKARTRAPRNKQAKPAENKTSEAAPAAPPAKDDASDPDASE